VNRKSILLLILRFILGVVFIAASVNKIKEPVAFADSIDNYRMLPYVLVSLMAIILPWVELIVGLLLIVGRWLKTSSLIVIALNIVFIVAISSAMIRGLDIECGCFSVKGNGVQVGVLRLVEDFVFLTMAFIIYRTDKVVNPATRK